MKSNQLVEKYATYTLAQVRECMFGEQMHADPLHGLWQQKAEQAIQNMKAEIKDSAKTTTKPLPQLITPQKYNLLMRYHKKEKKP